jgi:hypothetical protein
MFFQGSPPAHILSLFCFYLVGMEEMIGGKGSGVPRTVPAAARAGRRYFVKAIANSESNDQERSTVGVSRRILYGQQMVANG